MNIPDSIRKYYAQFDRAEDYYSQDAAYVLWQRSTKPIDEYTDDELTKFATELSRLDTVISEDADYLVSDLECGLL